MKPAKAGTLRAFAPPEAAAGRAERGVRVLRVPFFAPAALLSQADLCAGKGPEGNPPCELDLFRPRGVPLEASWT